MFQQFNISRSGFGVYQKMMFNITNNIANANTTGYKQTRVELCTLFPTVLSEAQAMQADEEVMNPYARKRRGIELGTGVQIQGMTKDFKSGTLNASNRNLDIAITGSGFLQLRLEDGRTVYTRAGNLKKDSYGNLMSQGGHFLEPPIRFPQDSIEESITFTTDGKVFVKVADDPADREVGQILLSNFPNPDGLKMVGQNNYEETVESGEPIIDVPGRRGLGEIQGNFTEGSNVDIIRELMEMIMVQKGLELLGKAMNSGTKMLNAGMGVTDK